jgi:hypothetical protein
MADTERSLAAILTLLADNSSGAISAQDIRDAVVTLHPGHADMYISASAETSIANLNEWTLIAGTTTTGAVTENWTMSANNTMRLDSIVTRNVLVNCAISMTAAGNNKTYEIAFAKNGSVITASKIQRKIGTGLDVGSAALTHILQMDLNDTISVYVRNTTDDTNFTATAMNMTLLSFVE